jgi:hypothetical protein
MSTSLFRNKQQRVGSYTPATPLDNLVAGIRQQLNSNGSTFASKEYAHAAMSMESIDATTANELDRCVNSLNLALEQIVDTHVIKRSDGAPLTTAQKQAAVAAGIMAGDIPGFLNAPVARSMVAAENMTFFGTEGIGDSLQGRISAAMEAYDEKENKNAVVYSVAYNMQAARQDEFGETFFPTVVVTPDQVGYTVSIRLISVYNEVRRQITGAVDNFNKRNIVQAVIDPTILKNDQTRIVPVYRTQAASNFIDPALYAPKTILLDGESITTAPLKMGNKFGLLAISQTDAMLETGLNDSTDSIDTAIRLESVYLKIVNGAETDLIQFNTGKLPLATFQYSVQQNYRVMTCIFDTNILQVTGTTTNVNGVLPAAFAPILAGGYSVRLSVQVSGGVNLELGDTNLFPGNVGVVSVIDGNGVSLDLTTGAGLTIANLFANASAVGYDLDARRTNLNRRMRGQLLDTTFYNQIYAVPLRSPITVPRPLTIGVANDSSDLAALITATHIRTSNAAVSELLKAQDLLAEFVNTADGLVPGTLGSLTDNSGILGVARFLVQPFYEHATLDVASLVDSIKSSDRIADIQALLVNKLRDMAYRMYRDSGYKAAADALAGGISQVPTVIIGTDPVISRYLTVTGDFRTLGNDFNVKVVSTLNMTMAGKIIMTFGAFGDSMDGVPNPMHFGNMAWKPELTLVLPLHRNGANSKELTVQPSFLHVVNLPIMAALDITGISDVVSAKVPVHFLTVTSDLV